MQYSALLTPMIKNSSGGLTPTLLILAGLYQLTPLKHACLKYCRTPVGFLMAEWRDGLGGAVRMGVKHGLYCTGCCCALILLLFAASAMKPIWIVALTIVVALEKWLRLPNWLSYLFGGALIAAGIAALL